MFSLNTNKVSTPKCSAFALPTLNNIALHFPLYLGCNQIAFDDLSIEQKEFELHEYLTHELGLNVFSDIKNESEQVIIFTFGFQEKNESIEINVSNPISSQIENLVCKYEAFNLNIAA